MATATDGRGQQGTFGPPPPLMHQIVSRQATLGMSATLYSRAARALTAAEGAAHTAAILPMYCNIHPFPPPPRCSLFGQSNPSSVVPYSRLDLNLPQVLDGEGISSGGGMGGRGGWLILGWGERGRPGGWLNGGGGGMGGRGGCLSEGGGGAWVARSTCGVVRRRYPTATPHSCPASTLCIQSSCPCTFCRCHQMNTGLGTTTRECPPKKLMMSVAGRVPEEE